MMEENLDRILKMLLYGRKERNKGRKSRKKKYMWGPLFFILPKLEGKLFSTDFNVKLSSYPHF